jgi:CSLREA domain-containing protein
VITITVTKTADDSGLTCTAGSCSLRGGITKANNQATGTLVVIQGSTGIFNNMAPGACKNTNHRRT